MALPASSIHHHHATPQSRYQPQQCHRFTSPLLTHLQPRPPTHTSSPCAAHVSHILPMCHTSRYICPPPPAPCPLIPAPHRPTPATHQVCSLPEPGVVLMSLSPAGGYLVTAQRPGKDEGGTASKNLKVGGGRMRRVDCSNTSPHGNTSPLCTPTFNQCPAIKTLVQEPLKPSFKSHSTLNSLPYALQPPRPSSSPATHPACH